MREPDSLGEFVRRVREERGLSQEQVAEFSGRTRGYISKLERGRGDASTITFETLWSLARALGIETSPLLAEFFRLAGPRWEGILVRIADAVDASRGGPQVSLEIAIEQDGSLDSKAKQRLLGALESERVRIEHEATQIVHRRIAGAGEGGA